MVRTPRKPKKSPKTQNRESQFNITKDQRSEFGKILYNDCLRGDGRKLTQKELSEAMRNQGMNVQESVISDLMYRLDPIGYDQDAYDFLYGMFKALDTLHVPITEELVTRFLEAANPDRFHIHITEEQQKALISQLYKEGIIRQEYKTKWGTELIGREKNIRAVWNMLVEEKEQFVTIVGLPGVGKTEIARQIIEIAKEGEYFANIDSLSIGVDKRDVDKVLLLIDETLKKYDPRKRTLLVIHNCEQFTDMAKAREELYDLVNNRKQLTILATSRATLSSKYHELKPFDVEPLLRDETIGTLQNNDAVRLFLGIANRNGKVLTLDKGNAHKIAAICKGLGGLPLALEITASRVSEGLTIDGVYESLRTNKILTLPHAYPDSDRQKTLFLLIKWSYDLLFTPPEQKLFIRLAIFDAPCHIEAVAAICTLDDVPKEQLSDFLWKLNDHRLITFNGEVIAISHTTIYQFASEIYEEKIDEIKVNIITQFIEYYYWLVIEYNKIRGQLHFIEEHRFNELLKHRVKKIDATHQPKLAEYHRLLKGEYHNIWKAYDLIIASNKTYIEEETQNRAIKENYDTYVRIQEEIHYELIRWRRVLEGWPTPIPYHYEEPTAKELQKFELLILLPEMGLANDYEFLNEISGAATDALDCTLNAYPYLRMYGDLRGVHDIIAHNHQFFQTDEENETLARYKQVYDTRLQLMKECCQRHSLIELWITLHGKSGDILRTL